MAGCSLSEDWGGGHEDSAEPAGSDEENSLDFDATVDVADFDELTQQY